MNNCCRPSVTLARPKGEREERERKEETYCFPKDNKLCSGCVEKEARGECVQVYEKFTRWATFLQLVKKPRSPVSESIHNPKCHFSLVPLLDGYLGKSRSLTFYKRPGCCIFSLTPLSLSLLSMGLLSLRQGDEFTDTQLYIRPRVNFLGSVVKPSGQQRPPPPYENLRIPPSSAI